MKPALRIILPLVVIGIGLLSFLRGGPVRLVDTRPGVMGTLFSVEVSAPDEETASAACAAAYRRIADLEAAMSTWIDNSVLSRVNREAAEHPVEVDADTLAVLLAARAVHETSGGAFDPSVGPLLAVWKPLAKMKALPSDAAVETAKRLVGYDGIRIDPVARTVAFARPGMALDVGGIAKGYAADEAAEVALAAGATACRVNAGGDLAARGVPHWDPRGFEVLVRDPRGGRADSIPGRSFFVTDRGVATSGNYERFTEVDGIRYSHILDPRTGRPVPNAVAQVTVVAPTGMEADAWATALVVLGPEKGLPLAERRPGVEALYLLPAGDGLREIATNGFPASGALVGSAAAGGEAAGGEAAGGEPGDRR